MSAFVRPSWLRFTRRLALAGVTRGSSPLEQNWGWDRGHPIDRTYIETFLDQHRSDIRGHVLEIGNERYTRRFGADVARSDVLDVDPANTDATIVADLACAEDIAPDLFDCFILTQTLQYIFDVRTAVWHAHRILRPGGVLLATLPCMSRIDSPPLSEVDYWRFTPAGSKRLLEEAFGSGNVTVSGRGNAVAAMAFVTGLATEDLLPADLVTHDALYPVIVTIRAVKQRAWSG